MWYQTKDMEQHQPATIAGVVGALLLANIG